MVKTRRQTVVVSSHYSGETNSHPCTLPDNPYQTFRRLAAQFTWTSDAPNLFGSIRLLLFEFVHLLLTTLHGQLRSLVLHDSMTHFESRTLASAQQPKCEVRVARAVRLLRLAAGPQALESESLWAGCCHRQQTRVPAVPS